MAPTIRPNTQTRRGHRGGYVEHDDFEGLPVRQWRQEWVSIAPPPQAETTQKNDIWAPELPHGMPKDSQLLPTHTQELLRAARSGRLYKRPLPAEEEEAEADAAPEKPEKKEEDPSTEGFMVKIWKQIPRNAEGPTISHLAKRRKGLVTLSSNLPAGATSGPTVTKATVRRVDAAGNPYTQEVTLAEGQAVDGEIISTTVVPAPNNANGDNAAATPVRRRPPPPKRKAKGPGRGRKKKFPLPVSARPEGTGAPGVEATAGGVKPEGAGPDDMKREGENNETKNQDSEMADGDDDEEGDDDGDDGEEGEDGDEEDGEVAENENGTPASNNKEASVDQEVNNSPSVEPPAITTPLANPDAMDISTEEESTPSGNQTLPPSTSLPPLQPSHLTSPQFEGSPLKNVLIPSPTEAAPIVSPTPETLATTAVAPEILPEPVSEPSPLPVESVETPQLPVSENMVQETSIEETTIIEPEVPEDIEMTDSVPPQVETIVETEILSTNDPEVTPAIVEEIVETTLVPLNDEPSFAQPPIIEELTKVTDAPLPDIIMEPATIPSPVLEQPASSVETPAPEPVSESLPEEVPSLEVQMTETSETDIPPTEDVPTVVEESTEILPTAAEELVEALATAPEELVEALVTAPEESAEALAIALEEPAEALAAALEEPATILPPLNPLQTESVTSLLVVEENEPEPESPDLLGGLEAALDQHDGPENLPSATIPVEAPAVEAPPVAEPISVPSPAPPADAEPVSTSENGKIEESIPEESSLGEKAPGDEAPEEKPLVDEAPEEKPLVEEAPEEKALVEEAPEEKALDEEAAEEKPGGVDQ